MIINTNINSLNAQRHLAGTTDALQRATERLSSGLRINKAADDAAGLAIADRMTAQIRGFNQARRNANDGISLVQTAEGAIVQLTTNLQRMRELSVQAANDTNTSSDRIVIQKEIYQLQMEMTRIANQTQFNRRDLLNGTFSAQQFQVGANSAQIITIDMKDARAQSVGNSVFRYDGGTAVTVKSEAADYWTKLAPAGDSQSDQKLLINGKNVDAVQIDILKGSSVGVLAKRINEVSNETDVRAVAKTDVVLSHITSDRLYTIGLRSIKIDTGATLTDPILNPEYRVGFWVNKDGDLSEAVEKINEKTKSTGVQAQLDLNDPRRIILTQADGYDILFDAHLAVKSDGTADEDAKVSVTQMRSFQKVDGYKDNDPLTNPGTIGNKQGATIDLTFKETEAHAVRAFGSIEVYSENTFTLDIRKGDDGTPFTETTRTLLGNTKDNAKAFTPQNGLLNSVADIDVSTRNGSNDAIKVVDAALTRLDSLRADLGAIQNRLIGTISNLRVAAENLTAARSRIQDADYAEESAALSSASILQQAGTAMLAQANQQPQLALQLLQR